jgi:hypothetical protein
MSQDEIGIRDLLLEISKKQDAISEKQEVHISSSNDFREKVNQQLTELNLHYGYTNASVKDHEKRIGPLEISRTYQRAAMWTFGLIWTGILSVISIFKAS